MTKRIFKFDEPAVGTDAEVFFMDAKGNPYSSEGWLGGRKGNPTLCEGGGYLEDCVAVELNVDPVTASQGAHMFLKNIRACMDAVKVRGKKLDLSVDISTELKFNKENLRSIQARESGCMPTYDAWNLCKNEPRNLAETDYRFAAGDIHVSWPGKDNFVYSRVNVARMMDIAIGFQEILLTERPVRSDWYGLAGSHRPTEYGVEYKAAGNFWLKTDNLIIQAFNTALKCVEIAESFGGELAMERHKNAIVSIRKQWAKDDARYYIREELGMPVWKV